MSMYSRGVSVGRLVAELMLVAPVRMLSAQEWSWNSERVARGSTSSIVIDSDRNLQLAYLTRDAKVYYAMRPAGASKWYSLVVLDSTHANTNVYPKLVVDKHDIPHLCVSFGILEYVTLTNHEWVKQQIDPGSGTI